MTGIVCKGSARCLADLLRGPPKSVLSKVKVVAHAGVSRKELVESVRERALLDIAKMGTKARMKS